MHHSMFFKCKFRNKFTCLNISLSPFALSRLTLFKYSFPTYKKEADIPIIICSAVSSGKLTYLVLKVAYRLKYRPILQWNQHISPYNQIITIKTITSTHLLLFEEWMEMVSLLNHWSHKSTKNATQLPNVSGDSSAPWDKKQ